MSTVSSSAIRAALQVHAGLENAIVDDNLHDKCAILCDKYQLTANTFVDSLEAFLVETNKQTIGMEDISKIEQRLHKHSAAEKQKQVQMQAQMQTQQQNQRQILKQVASNISSSSPSMATTATGKRALPQSGNTVTPSTDFNQRPMKMERTSDTPSSFSFSPALDSQTSASSSSNSSNGPAGETFRKRVGRFQSVASMNTSIGSRAEFVRSDRGALGMRCVISTTGDDINNCEGRYRYMFTTLEERARNLDRHLLKMQSQMCERANLKPEDLQPVGIPSPDVVWVCGRICCEAETGRINNQAVMLEGSRRDSGGRRIKLDLQELQAYSLFPGQIVLVEGINSGGRRMVVKRIVEGFPSDLPKSVPQKLLEFNHSTLYQGGEPVNICVAAGPFTTSDSLSYEPFRELLQRVLEKKPDVLVLVGPFVDISQPLLSTGEVVLEDMDDDNAVVGTHDASYEMVFIERIIRDGLSSMFSEDETLPTNVILVPSLLDAHHECVFPQPPFGDRDEVNTEYFSDPLGVLNIPHNDPNDVSRKRVHLLPNPCMFRINEVLFGVTSVDVLFALSSDEVSHNTPGNRLDRLVAHLLQQQSFCPQFPIPQNCLSQLDLRHASKWQMQRSPDVMILPSKLQHMAREVLGTVIVNPGSLAKGINGGSFADIAIHPYKEDELRAMHLADPKMEVQHNVPARTSINIMKI